MEYLEKLYIHVTGTSINWDTTLLPRLQRLKLVGKLNLELFSQWTPKHQNLVRLSLTFSKLNDPVESLKHLPNLSSLHLWDAYDGITLHFKNGMFQKLKNLDLIRLKSLNSIHIGEGALPSLKQLTLQDIPNLEEVPSGMNNLHNLEILWIKEMPEEFDDRIRKNVCINNMLQNSLSMHVSKKKVSSYLNYRLPPLRAGPLDADPLHADQAQSSYSYF